MSQIQFTKVICTTIFYKLNKLVSEDSHAGLNLSRAMFGKRARGYSRLLYRLTAWSNNTVQCFGTGPKSHHQTLIQTDGREVTPTRPLLIVCNESSLHDASGRKASVHKCKPNKVLSGCLLLLEKMIGTKRTASRVSRPAAVNGTQLHENVVSFYEERTNTEKTLLPRESIS